MLLQGRRREGIRLYDGCLPWWGWQPFAMVVQGRLTWKTVLNLKETQVVDTSSTADAHVAGNDNNLGFQGRGRFSKSVGLTPDTGAIRRQNCNITLIESYPDYQASRHGAEWKAAKTKTGENNSLGFNAMGASQKFSSTIVLARITCKEST